MPEDRAFFIGYSVDQQDYLYEVAYGTQPGVYSDTLTLQNRGVCKIPNLRNQQTYYYKMRLRKQWGFASEWSHEITVTPDGSKVNGTPKIRGIVSDGKKSILLFHPVEKATGYQLKTNDGKVMIIPTAQNGFFNIEDEVESEGLQLMAD